MVSARGAPSEHMGSPPRTDTNNGETFMRKDSLLATVTPRPVRSAVADFLGACDELGPLCRGVVDAVGDDDSAHRESRGLLG